MRLECVLSLLGLEHDFRITCSDPYNSNSIVLAGTATSNTIMHPESQPSSSKQQSMALRAPLLRTTRKPIWTHPLAWGINHLRMLHIFVQSIPQVTNFDDPDTAAASDGSGGLSVGKIAASQLKFLHQIQKLGHMDTYLAGFISRIVDTFQQEQKSKPFRYRSAG